MKKTLSLFIFVAFSVCLQAKTMYVDNQLSSNCLGNYSISNRNCSGWDGDAYNNMTEAANIAVAGDIVLIRAGTYSLQLAPQNSGTPGNYISFKNYMNEQVIISGSNLAPALWLEQKSFIKIEGIIIKNVQRWLNALGCNNLIIQNNTFKNANDSFGSSKTGLFFQSCNYIKILNNIIDSTTQDNLGMIDSDYNLIEGNTFSRASHTLWAIKCGNYNIIRKNYFHNEFQKIGEIYDCDEVGFGSSAFPKITSVDDSKHNIVEDNIFAYTPPIIDKSPYNGLQFAGQNCIIRRNIFYSCTGGGIGMTYYGGEAEYNYGNRIYNNVFYDNHQGGISISSTTASGFTDNSIKNNIFYKNNYVQYDTRDSWYYTLDMKPIQINTRRKTDVNIERNNIFSSKADELWTITYGSAYSGTQAPQQSISWWELNYPAFINKSMQVDPMFTDTAAKNFHLIKGSPMIDEGIFLSKTINDGTMSTTMVLDTANYFSSGFGITGGDTIQLEGQTQTAVIIAIDYLTNTLTLNNPLSWTKGQKLSFKYFGTHPDLGAFEYNSGLTSINNDKTEDDDFIQVYPNPTKSYFNIDYSLNNSSSMIINIISVDGKTVYTEKLSNIGTGIFNRVLDMSQQAKGIYVIQVITKTESIFRKIVLE